VLRLGEYDRSCYLVNMPSQQKQRADGKNTREAIVREAVSLATLDGLEGLSIGNLAGALDMSKSGIYAHFGSKQDLQLATVDEAGRIFQAEVIEPALAAAPGLAQLVAVCDAFFDHLMRRTFPGGCFFAGAVLEMGARPGPVKEQVAAFQSGFTAQIREFIITALGQHEIPADEDPDALAFELNGIILAANANFVLREDPAALNMARNIVRRRLGITTTTAPPPRNGTKSNHSKAPRTEETRKSRR
jgi:AcrR family transcriptional regulator